MVSGMIFKFLKCLAGMTSFDAPALSGAGLVNLNLTASSGLGIRLFSVTKPLGIVPIHFGFELQQKHIHLPAPREPCVQAFVAGQWNLRCEKKM